VVVQSLNSAILNPFGEAASRPAVLQCDADSLARGLLVWQGDGDFLDKRIPFALAPPAGLTGDGRNSLAHWTQLWGTGGVRRPVSDMLTSKAFDGNSWTLERLAIAFPTTSSKRKPGADLSLFGVDKKKTARPL
jgi:hypothetical protein